jgi:ATP-dependent DNA helicase RecG
MVALANTSGGSIFIGIEDDGTVSGVDRTSWEEKIVQIARNCIEPGLMIQTRNHTFNEKNIIEIILEKGPNRPYKVKNSNKYYIRVGNVSIEPSQEELIRLFQILRDYGFADKMGRGIFRLIKYCRTNNLPDPEFIPDNNSLTVVLFKRVN